jgi:GntR family transcriptional regulator/MocR family aminotransferase
LGCPSFDSFPVQEWAKLVARHFKNAERGVLDYSIDVLGYKPLREAISEYLKQARAVNCHPDRIIITERIEVFGDDAGMHVVVRLNVALTRDEILDRSQDFTLELVSTNPYLY